MFVSGPKVSERYVQYVNAGSVHLAKLSNAVPGITNGRDCRIDRSIRRRQRSYSVASVRKGDWH